MPRLSLPAQLCSLPPWPPVFAVVCLHNVCRARCLVGSTSLNLLLSARAPQLGRGLAAPSSVGLLPCRKHASHGPACALPLPLLHCPHCCHTAHAPCSSITPPCFSLLCICVSCCCLLLSSPLCSVAHRTLTRQFSLPSPLGPSCPWASGIAAAQQVPPCPSIPKFSAALRFSARCCRLWPALLPGLALPTGRAQ